MPTYVYETLSGKKTFEVSHPMAQKPLSHHPETKEPIRRIISGGFSVKRGKTSQVSFPMGGHCCGSRCKH